MTVRVQSEPIDPGALLSAFSAGRATSGAVVSFTGLTRDMTDGQAVTGLEIDAYPGFTDRIIAELVAETRTRFAIDDVLVAHRHGPIRVGEPIVFVAVATPHRRDAFQACDHLMDLLKTRAPFWKREDGPHGPRWVEARPSDHIDAARWETP